MNGENESGKTAIIPGMRRKGWRSWRLMKYVMRTNSSPEQIALGAAIGMFVAFTPTFGIQMIITVVLASLFRANRLASIPPVWITNIVTAPPIFAFAYWLGMRFLPGREQEKVRDILRRAFEEVSRHGWFDIQTQWQVFMDIAGQFFIPMLIGGCLIGLVLAVPTYPLMLWMVRRHRARRGARLKERFKHWQERLKAHRHPGD